MKIISGLGGSGTTFVLDALDHYGSKRLFGIFDWYELTSRLNLSPRLFRQLRSALLSSGMRVSDLCVLRRPDSFWTDWAFNPPSRYSPQDSGFAAQILAQRDYLLKTARGRSAGLLVRRGDLSTASLTELVSSYSARLQAIEKDLRGEIVLVCGHWAEYGILQELGVETIYLIRDPFNSIVSHSKPARHQKDYLRRGLTALSSQEWIDTYLVGPHHYWIRYAECALSHSNATIVRYYNFPADWQQVHGLPDISAGFDYRANKISEVLPPELIDYIYSRTREICRTLGFDEIYYQSRGS